MQKNITIIRVAVLVLLQWLLFCTFVSAQSCIISTYAGVGIRGYYGDGVPATECEMSSPAGLTVDNAGNLYMADYSNDRIRKVTAATGIITTIAGRGMYAPDSGAYSGDGGPATAADLYDPCGVAVDAAGNIFIADYGNCRIRKISVASGIISTIAGNGIPGYSGDGGDATSAKLYYPFDIAFDAAGDLYIADFVNCRIRKITISTGIITTIAGNGIYGYSGDGGPATRARLNRPSSLAFDRSGNLYFSEFGNSTVREVNAVTGIIATVAGTGVASYSGDGGAATAAEIYEPLSMTLDTIGNIYIADRSPNNRIRMVSATTGIITTIAGNGTAGYTGDGGYATAAELNYPDGVAIDAGGNLYTGDAGNSVIRKMTSVYTLGIPESENLVGGTLVYPNPVIDELTLTTNTTINKVEIYNLLGQCVFTGEYNADKVKIDMREMQAGMYIVKFNGQEVNEVVKE